MERFSRKRLSMEPSCDQLIEVLLSSQKLHPATSDSNKKKLERHGRYQVEGTKRILRKNTQYKDSY